MTTTAQRSVSAAIAARAAEDARRADEREQKARVTSIDSESGGDYDLPFTD